MYTMEFDSQDSGVIFGLLLSGLLLKGHLAKFTGYNSCNHDLGRQVLGTTTHVLVCTLPRTAAGTNSEAAANRECGCLSYNKNKLPVF